MIFKNRQQAGSMLAFELKKHIGKKKWVIAGIASGGFELACYLKKELKQPAIPLFIKKIGHRQNPEFAIGAVSSHEVFINNYEKIDPEYIKFQINKLRSQISILESKHAIDYQFANKNIILVDDGAATGLTLKTALAHLNSSNPGSIILALPVISQQAAADVSAECNIQIFLYQPSFFMSVSQFYHHFPQISSKQLDELIKGKV